MPAWEVTAHAVHRYIERINPELSFHDAQVLLTNAVHQAKPLGLTTIKGDAECWELPIQDAPAVVGFVRPNSPHHTLLTIAREVETKDYEAVLRAEFHERIAKRAEELKALGAKVTIAAPPKHVVGVTKTDKKSLAEALKKSVAEKTAANRAAKEAKKAENIARNQALREAANQRRAARQQQHIEHMQAEHASRTAACFQALQLAVERLVQLGQDDVLDLISAIDGKTAHLVRLARERAGAKPLDTDGAAA